jgi:hypothetical protein
MPLSYLSPSLVLLAGVLTALPLLLLVLVVDVRRAYRSDDPAEHAAAGALAAQMAGAAAVIAGACTALCIYTGNVIPAIVCACFFWLSAYGATRLIRVEREWRERHVHLER